MGAACPLDSTNRSLFGFFGFLGSNLMTEKNRVATISAAERQLVGCPLPAAVVARTLRIRKRVASFLRLATISVVLGKGNSPSLDGWNIYKTLARTGETVNEY